MDSRLSAFATGNGAELADSDDRTERQADTASFIKHGGDLFQVGTHAE